MGMLDQSIRFVEFDTAEPSAPWWIHGITLTSIGLELGRRTRDMRCNADSSNEAKQFASQEAS
jgi:hypothetical protein